MPFLYLVLDFDPACFKRGFDDHDRFRDLQDLKGNVQYEADDAPEVLVMEPLTQSNEIVIDKEFDPIGAISRDPFKRNHFVDDMENLALMQPFHFDDGIHELPLFGFI